MPLFRDAPVRIQPFFGYRSADRLVLQARALRSGSRSFAPAAGRWQAIRTMIAQYASREAAGVEVSLQLGGPDGECELHHATSDEEGFVRFEVALGHGWDLPLRPAWEVARLGWSNVQGPQTAAAHVLAPGRDSALAVISDIDDTIIETGITGGLSSVLRNWRRVLARWPEERIAAPGADVFYSALGGGDTVSAVQEHVGERLTATHRPFFYVSSSPWNLFSYLVAFKRSKGLPLGPLLLRDWGLNRATFSSSSHGGHKAEAIAHILALYPGLGFALIGDDTQGDLAAFADVVARNEGRVAAVFIRRVSSEPLSVAEEDAAAAIRSAGVPLWIGASWSAGHGFLDQLGMSGDEEAERIVSAVEGSSSTAKPDS
ncbi:phosphatase domain-containing protein [Alteraurantiacibacter aquimixticola]|uniref:DUF2183 domain-containing protein n=1 Tax=Alteraurantiacibacter aquimixticola TaxID=2489173 RepID=A0A4T3EZT0_9SPHN|nr:phosphatase domain-containing protein [Alteraurantiacibacter aquimixticola]TIX49084.1 DUF2183 domain-containing protein [Alteraurantiacibacter aquimixticola]